MGLIRINQLDRQVQQKTYFQLVPPRCLTSLAELNPAMYGSQADPANVFRVLGEPAHEAHLRMPAARVRGDFCFSLDLEEAGAGQLQVGFVLVNDLASPRFDIDRDEQGQLTLLGTASRNLAEEARAMAAGLGPCQVRSGLRLFGELMPRLEDFARRHGYVAIVLEPLTYHNAVMYEKYGFAYINGRSRMRRINEAFRPGGVLYEALDSSTVFRRRVQYTDPRGRSWAIHDGILEMLDGDVHLDLKMVKVVGQHAGEKTFAL